ncbi:hypothetical protein FSP39_025401 [Pinctada imbricata]|uniref:Uncharacterized protein n=1 Tax=Pinctada imbricata TaxID=66713 RepID=A0AA88YH90_PINIB|nr:hypothetical protein FSP39_025401 [Pinctada imbricata]
MYLTDLPRKVSDWTNEHLQDLGINYHDNSTSIQDFTSRLQRDVRNFKPAVTDRISQRLNECTSEIWSSSLNLNDKEFGIHSIDWGIDEIEGSVRRLARMNESTLEESDETKKISRVFWAWHIGLLSFLTTLKKFLRKLLKDTRKACFTELFKTFTKICLLDPESGEVYTGTKTVKGLEIQSIPDVRYVSCSDQLQMMMIFSTEVTKDDAFRGEFSNDTFCYENLSTQILGQHGIKLLIEAQNSCFWPRVAGVICVGTKVIFTYLDISKKHLERLTKKTSILDSEASILYTRPYDFLNQIDRKDMLKLLFWFGYVQTGGYELYVAEK